MAEQRKQTGAGGERRTIPIAVSAFLLSRPKTLLVMIALIIAGIATQLPHLRVEGGLKSMFREGSPLDEIRNRVNDAFINDDLIYIAYQAEDVFSRESLERVRTMGQRLEALKVQTKGSDEFFAVADVTSLTTVKDLVGSDLTFRTVPLVPDPVPDDAATLAEIERRARNNAIIRDNLLAADSRSAIVSARLPQEFGDDERAASIQGILSLMDELGDDGLRYYLSGKRAFDFYAVKYNVNDLRRFLPITYALMGIALFLFVRRVAGTLAALLIATLNVAASLALLVLVGGSIGPMATTLPLIIMTVTVAGFLHYISELTKNSRVMSDDEARRHTISELLTPMLIAALTTGIGFVSLYVIDVPMVQDFGLATGGGILISFGLTTTIFALFIRRRQPEAYVSMKSIAVSGWFDDILGSFARVVIARHRPLLFLSTIFIVIIGLGILQINVDHKQLEIYDEDTPIRQATSVIDDHLGGTTLYVLSVRAADRDRFLDPAELAKLDALAVFLGDTFKMERVSSVVDYVKIMNREFFDGDPAQYRIPDTAEQVAQLMLLNGDQRLREFIDEQNQWVRVTGRNTERSAKAVMEDYARLDAYLAQHFPASAGYEAHATGLLRLYCNMITTLLTNMVLSLLITSITIFAFIFLMFRSFRVGIICLVPNVLPLATGLGMCAWLRIDLNPYTATLSAVALGIAVDDTVHFIQHLRSRLQLHGDLERGITETFHTKGPALVWTSVVVGMGFSVFLVSNFAPARYLGMLMCMAMAAALLGDLIMLPSLILVLKSKLGIKQVERKD